MSQVCSLPVIPRRRPLGNPLRRLLSPLASPRGSLLHNRQESLWRDQPVCQQGIPLGRPRASLRDSRRDNRRLLPRALLRFLRVGRLRSPLCRRPNPLQFHRDQRIVPPVNRVHCPHLFHLGSLAGSPSLDPRRNLLANRVGNPRDSLHAGRLVNPLAGLPVNPQDNRPDNLRDNRPASQHHSLHASPRRSRLLGQRRFPVWPQHHNPPYNPPHSQPWSQLLLLLKEFASALCRTFSTLILTSLRGKRASLTLSQLLLHPF